MKIYFCGSIRGGRQLATAYGKMIRMLQNYGEVLTEHIGDESMIGIEGESLSDDEIYERDMGWLLESDIIIAEVTVPSIGVGYEIGRAIGAKKPVLCLFDANSSNNLSAMIAGCPDLETLRYNNLEEIEDHVKVWIKKINNQ